jgi:hypothetical protein
MLTVLLYGYCEGERSSRQLEKLCQESVAYRIASANQCPDHSTFARFRAANIGRMKHLFLDVLRFCFDAGFGNVGKVALDGTKMKGNASLSSNRTFAGLEKEIEKMFAEAEAIDAEEDKKYGKDKRGDEIPEEFADPRTRKARIKECLERLNQEKDKQKAEQEEKIQNREDEEKRTGKKKRGRKPKSPKKKEDEAKSELKANITDPDSRVMKTRSGYVQGYNCQAVTTTEEQLILAAEITQEANDVKQLSPMLEQVQLNLGDVGNFEPVETALADAGYLSEGNLKDFDPNGPELYVATKKEHKQRSGTEAPFPSEVLSNDEMSLVEKMDLKLSSPEGRKVYKERSYTIEPIFGQIKYCRGIDTFMQRGFEACQSEWYLICLTHNLRKIWNFLKCGGDNTRSRAQDMRKTGVAMCSIQKILRDLRWNVGQLSSLWENWHCLAS